MAKTLKQGPVRDQKGTAKFRHQAVALVLQIRGDEGLCVLVQRRERAPFAGFYALPSGAVEVDESVDQSVVRHLAGLVDAATIAHLEQLATRSEVSRDPYDRTIATGYLALVPWDVETPCVADARWVPVDSVNLLGELAFDHKEFVSLGLQRLRAKLSYSNIAFALAADTFTIAQLRRAYQAVLGYEISATNLQRILLRRGQLVETGAMVPAPGGGRPAREYRFSQRRFVITDPFATFRP